MGENNTRFSFAAAWEDYDNDGDFDLYVANDYGRNNLYRNDGGQFHDVAVASGGTSIEEPPGPREGPSGVFHLAYIRDPDGNKLCALHRAKV